MDERRLKWRDHDREPVGLTLERQYRVGMSAVEALGEYDLREQAFPAVNSLYPALL
jgi:hypothetical protein